MLYGKKAGEMSEDKDIVIKWVESVDSIKVAFYDTETEKVFLLYTTQITPDIKFCMEVLGKQNEGKTLPASRARRCWDKLIEKGFKEGVMGDQHQ
jgi:hypothetical protein